MAAATTSTRSVNRPAPAGLRAFVAMGGATEQLIDQPRGH